MIQEAIQYIGLHTLCLTLPFNCDSWYTKRWLHQFHSVLWLLSYCIKAIRCKIATGSHVARASCLWNREICRTHWLWSVRQEFYKERGGGGTAFWVQFRHYHSWEIWARQGLNHQQQQGYYSVTYHWTLKMLIYVAFSLRQFTELARMSHWFIDNH